MKGSLRLTFLPSSLTTFQEYFYKYIEEKNIQDIEKQIENAEVHDKKDIQALKTTAVLGQVQG